MPAYPGSVAATTWTGASAIRGVSIRSSNKDVVAIAPPSISTVRSGADRTRIASQLIGHKAPEYRTGAAPITLRRYTHTSQASSNGRATSSTLPFGASAGKVAQR